MEGYRQEKENKTKISTEVRSGRKVDFGQLLEKNPDVKAWIYLPDSNIDYAVVQAEDNDYYLHRGLDREYCFEGIPFIDALNEAPFADINTVIYGHHMNSGSMFTDLDKYSDEGYFDRNRIIQIYTPARSYDLHVIAYCNERSDSELYRIYNSEDSFAELVSEKADILSDEEFSDYDRFVTLSTCAYNYEDARTLVIGVLRDPEIIEKTETVAVENPNHNMWHTLQILTGAVMALAVFLTVLSCIRIIQYRKQ